MSRGLLLALWLAIGCTGQIHGSHESATPGEQRGDASSGDPHDADDDPMPDSGSGDSGDVPVDDNPCTPPPSRVVRLSKLELQHSIEDLLHTTRAVALPDDAKFLNFSSNAGALVTSPFANALKSTAEALATDFRAALDLTDFGDDCAASEQSARGCASTFIERYGRKAYRRPLGQGDIDGLLAVYDAGRETGSDGDIEDRLRSGVDYTLRAILQSPDFLYRIELGDAATGASGIASLTPYEVASALSYMLIASPPDDALLDAAAAGELDSAQALETQARRLMRERPERFAAQQRRFVREWLAIDFTVPAWNKDPDIYPLYSPELKSALDEETDRYLDDWVATGPTLTSLLTRPEAFVNDVNAPLYGLSASPGEMTKVALDPEQRAGILTMAGFLGTHAHADSSAPILRGISIVRSVLCLTIAPPPPNVPQLPAITDMSFTTTRDRVEKHVANGACPACHSQINPLGYPFESYDGLGVFRTQENGFDVDSSGAIVGTESSDRPVANAVELSAALARSAEAQDCFSRQIFRYTFGREDSNADACAVDAAARAYRANDLDVRELLVSLVLSETFATRTPAGDP